VRAMRSARERRDGRYFCIDGLERSGLSHMLYVLSYVPGLP
jgi:hypothetical protein